jgi:exportin-2 (importin alpha re-exporter)
MKENVSSPTTLPTLFKILSYLCNIFYCLNAVDLPEFFEDNMNVFFEFFHELLTFDSTMKEVVGEEDDDKASLVHKVMATVCEILTLYIEKYEEEFQRLLPTFVTDVWNLLMKASGATRLDELTSRGIGFLGAVAKSVHHSLFQEAPVLRMICEKVILPNMRLQPLDLELFEDNPVEYLRRDMQGSDNETRRRAALELVRSLRKHYETLCTEICSAYTNQMLQEYAANPVKNWVAKDVAIYLVTALTVRGSTHAKGATTINQLVPILDFCSSQVLPELLHPNPPALILKADALKFLCIFRQQIPKQMFLQAMPALIHALSSDNYVIHSYAAITLERTLLVRDENTNTLRFTHADLSMAYNNNNNNNNHTNNNNNNNNTLGAATLTALFKVLESSGGELSKENDYVMRCIMRLLAVMDKTLAVPLMEASLTGLTLLLQRVLINPSNPQFNHYLWETIALMIKTHTPTYGGALFEAKLFPLFQEILQKDMVDFAPYVFQLLALLLEMCPLPVSDAYSHLLPALVAPLLWERSGNIPALTRLIQAYLQKDGARIVTCKQLLPILGIFQKLIANKVHDHEGFYILESIVDYLQPTQFAEFLPTIFQLLFMRLMPKDRTDKFLRSFLIFMSLFVGRHGAVYAVDSVNAVQMGLFGNLLETVWLPNSLKISGLIERKMAAIAMSRLMFDWPAAQAEPLFPRVWCQLLTTAVALLEGDDQEDLHLNSNNNNNNNNNNHSGENDDYVDVDEIPGYSSTFSKLLYGNKDDVDPFKLIQPKKLIATEVQKLAASKPQLFSIIQTSLTPKHQQALQTYFS